MKVLLIGNEQDMVFVHKCIKEPHKIYKTILWNNESGPEYLISEFFSASDCIVIAVKDRGLAKQLYEFLKVLPESSSKCIVDFYLFYNATIPSMTCERVLENPLNKKFQGMILGISHAMTAIVPRFLDISFCNLAVSSQDLYYNLKTMEYCIDKYYSKIKDIQYLIIDMFDYNYFNFDVTSCGLLAIDYYESGGYTLDGHNFNRNPAFGCSFDDFTLAMLYNKYQYIDEEQMDFWEMLFGDVHKHNGYAEFCPYPDLYKRMHILTDEEGEEFNASTGIVRNIFQDTINENVKCFKRILELAYKLNENIRVILLMLPRYTRVRERHALEMKPWKERFYGILDEVKRSYPFEMLDFTEHAISREKKYYHDAAHFNYYGAMEFTKMLNTYLQDYK